MWVLMWAAHTANLSCSFIYRKSPQSRNKCFPLQVRWWTDTEQRDIHQPDPRVFFYTVYVVFTCREITGLKGTRRTLLQTKHINNSVCPGIGRQGDKMINKYFLPVCAEELRRANRIDFTDAWFSSLVISIHKLWVLQINHWKTCSQRSDKCSLLEAISLYLHFFAFKKRNPNSSYSWVWIKKEKTKVLNLLFLFKWHEKYWKKWPSSAHFHVLLSGWAFTQL